MLGTLVDLQSKRIEALEKMCVCYRLHKRPSEKLLDKLTTTKEALEDFVWEGK